MGERVQLEQAIEYFLQTKKGEGLSPNTVSYYAEVCYRFAKNMPSVETTEQVDSLALRSYISLMQDDPKLKPVSVNRHVRGLRVFLKWLQSEDLVRANPFDRMQVRNPIKMPRFEQRDIDILTDEDFRKLLATCDRSTDLGRRDEAVLMFLFDTGVRIGELVSLTKANLDLQARQARIIGKGRKWRTVFFTPQTALALTRYLYKGRYESREHVFTARNGQRMVGFTVNQMLERRAKAAGVTARCNPHTFRHTFATNFLRLGGNPATLQRILGHSDISTTIRNYAHLVTDDLAAAHEQFSPMSRALGMR